MINYQDILNNGIIINSSGTSGAPREYFQSPEKLKEALSLIPNTYETEASGGINIDNIRPYAETGVQFISIGALTHSVKGLDLSLKASF